MRVGVIGAGAVGGHFGALLVRGGVDVTFIARGETLRALQSSGITINDPKGPFTAENLRVTDKLEALYDADLILLCTKSWQVEEILLSLRNHLSEHTMVIPLQNGIEASRSALRILGPQHVLLGCCYTISEPTAPGVIQVGAGSGERLLFGEVDNSASERTTRLLRLLQEVKGIAPERPDNIQHAQWIKFIWIAATGAIGAVTRVSADLWRSHLQTRELFLTLLTETRAVAQASGVDLSDNDVESIIRQLDIRPPGFTTSMQRDLSEGRPSELGHQLGSIVSQGAELGVPTPLSNIIYACLIPAEEKARATLPR